MQPTTETQTASKLASALYEFAGVPLQDRVRILQRMIQVEASTNDSSTSLVPVLKAMLSEDMYHLACETYPSELPNCLRETAERATARMLQNNALAAA